MRSISIKFFRLVYLLCYHYISLTFLTILLLGVLYEKRRDVGGGTGGIELATFLGDKLGRKKQAKVTLVDRNATHLGGNP